MQMATTGNTRGGATANTLRLIGAGNQFAKELQSLVESTPIFRDFSRREVETIAVYVQAYLAEKGMKLFAEGQKGECLYVLIDGRVDLYKATAGGQGEKLIHTVRGGKTLGEMSLLDGLPYSATAVASEPTRLLIMTKARFDQLAKEQPALCLKLVRGLAWLMSLRLRQTTGILLDHLE